jgi:phosphoenolpyruvate synthase/pyruvate phosphate dikinase
MSPIDKSFITEEEEDLLKILIKKRKGKDIQPLLEEHQQKHFWITNNYAIQIKQDVQFFKDKLLKLHNKIKEPEKALKKADKHIENTKAQKQEIIKELKLDKEFLNLIKISELFAYMQDQRKKRVTMCNHYQRLFFEQVGKRLKIPVEEMENTVYPELREMLIDKKFDRKKLQSRRKHSLCIFPKGKWEVFDGKIVDEIYEQLFEVKSEGIEELQGTVASKGLATGKVRLIYKIKDMEHMQKGEIIISSMTRPEMVVAMKKAAAIVTDEGGITSHAAIVSRELGIPCILGTKIATKVFKNGDIAEVDANNGIVRKLN